MEGQDTGPSQRPKKRKADAKESSDSLPSLPGPSQLSLPNTILSAAYDNPPLSQPYPPSTAHGSTLPSPSFFSSFSPSLFPSLSYAPSPVPSPAPYRPISHDRSSGFSHPFDDPFASSPSSSSLPVLSPFRFDLASDAAAHLDPPHLSPDRSSLARVIEASPAESGRSSQLRLAPITGPSSPFAVSNSSVPSVGAISSSTRLARRIEDVMSRDLALKLFDLFFDFVSPL